jgi:hypothetical protein
MGKNYDSFNMDFNQFSKVYDLILDNSVKRPCRGIIYISFLSIKHCIFFIFILMGVYTNIKIKNQKCALIKKKNRIFKNQVTITLL